MQTQNKMLGVPIWDQPLADLVAQSMQAIRQRDAREAPFVFACANPHSLAVADRDAVFKSALLSADAVVADGVGVTLAARLMGRRIGPRITGLDYFRAVMTSLDEIGSRRVMFFGSRQSVLDTLAARVLAEFPRTFTHLYSPPYGDWPAATNARLVAQINEYRPDVLWVGMTAPRQEKWVAANYRQLRCGLVGSIGAVFDYFAGTVQRAPQWVCDAGLEWAYRLSREPRRLWQRTFLSAPQFLGLALAERLRGRS